MKNGLLNDDNGIDKLVEVDASKVAEEYYTEYAKYVLEYRALPSVYDGLKPVQRRVIYTMNQQPMKLMKTAKAAGLVLAYHPHGDSSVVGTMNGMAHPLAPMKIFNTKGNFGSVSAGASAPRYTELCLSEVARFNFTQFVDYADYEVGEIGEMEPSSLPTLIPLCLISGSEGIGIGLSTKVMPLNLIDLIDYYIDYIKNDYKFSTKIVKPDVGHVVIDMDDSDVRDAVSTVDGRITTYSIITQISDNSILIEGLYGKSIDAAMNKVDKWTKWFTNGKVGFRDASGTFMKYVFEIFDSSISIKELKQNFEWATNNNSRFRRILEEDGNAVYSNLNYIVRKSLENLNKAIDKKNTSDLAKYKSSLNVYEVLELCKKANVFKDAASMTSEELIILIMKTSGCDESVAKEIIKKPISYLTKSHYKEIEDLKKKIEDIETHDRKKYLLDLYKEFRKMVLPYYEERKHSILRSEMAFDPKISFNKGVVSISHKGEEYDKGIYVVTESGQIFYNVIDSPTAHDIEIDTDGSPIVAVVTDKYKYLTITTNFKGYSDSEGKLSVDLSKIWSGKKVINFREDYSEKVVKAEGFNTEPDHMKTKISKTDWVKKE